MQKVFFITPPPSLKMSHAFYTERIQAIKDTIKDTERTLHSLHNDLHAFEVAAAEAAVHKVHAKGTKLKWVSDTNPESYCVAVVHYDGILEVKRVMDGQGLCHNTAQCACKPCAEIRLSNGLMPPWLKGAPLVKTFYKTSVEWLSTLPAGGSVTITEPPPSRAVIRMLANMPLKETTDARKLKELETRFPGARMMLLVNNTDEYTIKYITDAEKNPEYDSICCDSLHLVTSSFAQFEVYVCGKYELMAEWRGAYIGLSHLL